MICTNKIIHILCLVLFFCCVVKATKSCPKKVSIEDRLTSLQTGIDELNRLSKSMNETLKSCQPAKPACPKGWKKYGRSCYKADPTVMSWDQARAACRKQGADLVKISSEKENELVFDKLALRYASARQQVWIGLRWNATDNKYHWIDGTLPTFTKWNSGEPNGFRLEQCGHMWTDLMRKRNVARFWNDIPCQTVNYPNGYICEKPARM